MDSYQWDEDDGELSTCPTSNEDGTLEPPTFFPLDSYIWPTLSEEGTACPERVPVYCAEVPVECVTVPFPGSENAVTPSAAPVMPLVDANVNNDTDTNNNIIPAPINATEMLEGSMVGVELNDLWEEVDDNTTLILPEEMEENMTIVEEMQTTETPTTMPSATSVAAATTTEMPTTMPTSMSNGSTTEQLVDINTTIAPSVTMTMEETMVGTDEATNDMVTEAPTAVMMTEAPTSNELASEEPTASESQTVLAADSTTATNGGNDDEREYGEFVVPTSAAGTGRSNNWMVMWSSSFVLIVGSCFFVE